MTTTISELLQMSPRVRGGGTAMPGGVGLPSRSTNRFQKSVHQGRVELRRIDRATDPASLGQAVEDLPVALDETAHEAHELLVVSNPVDLGLERVEDQLVDAHTAGASEDLSGVRKVFGESDGGRLSRHDVMIAPRR